MLAEAFLSIRRESVRRALAQFVRVVAANDQVELSTKAAAE